MLGRVVTGGALGVRQHLVVGMLLVFLGSISAQAQDPARLALLIGNQEYADKVGPLKNPHNDIARIDEALRKLDFKTTLVKDAGSRLVKWADEPTLLVSGPVSCSRRRAAKLAAAKIIIRAGWVSKLERTLRDQNTTTHRPPTGHVSPSRIPYFNASS